jgi:hypothetical protein
MDVAICLNRLNVKPEILSLNQAHAPNRIVRWIGGDLQPTEAELEAAWQDHLAEQVQREAEQAWIELRAKRDQLLTETDYLALADLTLTDEMRAYRQALRDLPANTVDPANPVWPIKPGGN